jgi:hypothetical protein
MTTTRLKQPPLSLPREAAMMLHLDYQPVVYFSIETPALSSSSMLNGTGIVKMARFEFPPWASNKL